MSRTFGAVIIGDEILSGKRQDKHFEKIAGMLGARGLRLSWVEYLGDDYQRLAATFKRTMAAGDVVFSCGGIGNTPDDHTRQAVALALGGDLELHPQGFEELKVRFANEEITDQRKLLVTFPQGVEIIPNPFNRIPGFMANDHYFVPGFPQMAHPMIEWALDTFYRDEFKAVGGTVEKAFLLTGPTAYESALLDLMERIVKDYPTLRLFSLPSLNGQERRHLELGVEGEPGLVDQAMEEIRVEVETRNINWVWRA
ncbi:competence/damage-inducible protein A [Quatrionicoccus australiensis]|uniref:competence/damage-inducible protein A n=1 Tax=Quatrionicoccus australiensis TaxID=138118 RepID=UPI001CFA673F|nr:competence/damage-inducible protein A [Quatrionicoccus australiensis]MCB4360751.1 competence/damage-inducible protein A [Quatrionicoccus australiensis]